MKLVQSATETEAGTKKQSGQLNEFEEIFKKKVTEAGNFYKRSEY